MTKKIVKLKNGNKQKSNSKLYKDDKELMSISDDKYITKYEYIKNFGYPLTNFDYFLFEITNIIGSELSNLVKMDLNICKSFLLELIKISKEFYSECETCEELCLKKQQDKVPMNFSEDIGVPIKQIPIHLRNKIKINKFYFEVINLMCRNINYRLEKIVNSERAYDISSDIYFTILSFISDNCWAQCRNKCIEGHSKNVYCEFCLRGSEKLPCPVKNEISYTEIGAKENDMYLCD